MYVHLLTYKYVYRHVYVHVQICTCTNIYTFVHTSLCKLLDMGWLRLAGSLKLQVSFAKEPYKRDYILQKKTSNFKKPTNRSHRIHAYMSMYTGMCMYMYKSGLQFTCVYTHMYKQLAGERRSESRDVRVHIHTLP